jgi:hypothetical protein
MGDAGTTGGKRVGNREDGCPFILFSTFKETNVPTAMKDTQPWGIISALGSRAGQVGTPGYRIRAEIL